MVFIRSCRGKLLQKILKVDLARDFAGMGTRNPEKGIVAQIHTPEFDVDGDYLVVGTTVMANVLADFLEQHAPRK